MMIIIIIIIIITRTQHQSSYNSSKADIPPPPIHHIHNTTAAPSIVWCYVNVPSSVLLHIPVQINDSLVSMFTGTHLSTCLPCFFEPLSYTDRTVLCSPVL